jgi:hypothetical protein
MLVMQLNVRLEPAHLLEFSTSSPVACTTCHKVASCISMIGVIARWVAWMPV